MSLKCPERAQQRRHLAAGASIQKTVQGELGSAKRDPGSEAEKLARVSEPRRKLLRILSKHGVQRIRVRKTSGLAAVGQHCVGVFAAQVVCEALQHLRRGSADIDLG